MKPRYAIAAVASSLLALVAGCVSTVGTPPDVPASLKVPEGQTLSHELQATGVQIYDCSASKADPARLEWVFKAPEADLFDNGGRKVGKHYAGPTWEANDGSKVVGDVKGRDDGPDANAIPWLLLVAKSNSGAGEFGRTQSIQRVNTVGGKAPAGACAPAGSQSRVPYKATYYLYRVGS